MKNYTEKFYDSFSTLYPIVDWFLMPKKKSLFREINNLPHGKLLEIGVGNGKQLKYYKSHDITGIDSSVKMLKIAQNQKFNNTELLLMNGESLDFGNQVFDYVILSHVIAVVSDPNKLLEEVYRVLKPGGRVYILNHFTPNNNYKFIDVAFQPFAKIFGFRSVFYAKQLNALKEFRLLKEINPGRSSYFKLLIYRKS